MTAAAKNRDTAEFDFASSTFCNRKIPVKAATRIFAGTIIALDANGHATPATTATGLIIVGVAQALADNTAGGAAAISVDVKPGVYKFVNTGPIVQADLGKNCFVTDDQTVAKTDGVGTKSAAGKVFQVDTDGVWVAIGFTSLFA